MMQACDFLQVKAGFASFYFRLLSRFYLVGNWRCLFQDFRGFKNLGSLKKPKTRQFQALLLAGWSKLGAWRHIAHDDHIPFI
jgi:hypothetical protein